MSDMEKAQRVSDVLASETRFLTFGGVETYLIFQQKYPLRNFAAFEVYADEEAYAELQRKHLLPIAQAAVRNGFGLHLDCFTYKASPDEVAHLAYGEADMKRLNRNAVERMIEFRTACRATTNLTEEAFPILLSADLGPRGDGYGLGDDQPLTVVDARRYHAQQLGVLAETEVDFATAFSMTHVNEAIGIALAARDRGLPISVSPTVETNGKLPDGTPLKDFVNRVDDATGGYPLFYQVNCVHPIHLVPTLEAAASDAQSWLSRFKGIRANASSKTHAELDHSPILDRGDPADLARRMAGLLEIVPLRILGGCCGTDADHMSAIAAACAAN